MEVKCHTCGLVFFKEEHRYNRNVSGLHYCSKECYAKKPVVTQKKTGKEVPCEECGSIVYKSGAQLLRSKSGKHFCSKQCSAAYLSKQLSHNCSCDYCGSTFRKSPSTIGKSNYCSRECWKLGVQSSGPSYYRKFKKEVCEVCGFVPEDRCQLDVHHMDGDKKNNEEDNLQTLCANCHRLEHKGVIHK